MWTSFGDYSADDDEEEDWRGHVAQVLDREPPASKANRYIECSSLRCPLSMQRRGQHIIFSSHLLRSTLLPALRPTTICSSDREDTPML